MDNNIIPRPPSPIDNHQQNNDDVTLHENDVICGRGGPAVTHIGNLNYRALVERTKLLYVACPKSHKKYVSKSIIRAIKSQNPPGRFLEKDNATGRLVIISDERAILKTSQALRERPIVQQCEDLLTDDIDNNGLQEALSAILDEEQPK